MKKINFYVHVECTDSLAGCEHDLYLVPEGRASIALKTAERLHPDWIGRCKVEPFLTAPDVNSNNERHRITTISELPKGCYFRLVSPGTLKVNPTVYVRDDYDRSTKRYCAYRFDDVCSSRDFKFDRLVCIDFTF